MCVCLKQPVEELDGTESLSLREPSFSLPIFELGHQSSAAFGLRLDLKPLSLLDLWLGNCTYLDLSAFMINVSQFLQPIYLSIYLPTDLSYWLLLWRTHSNTGLWWTQDNHALYILLFQSRSLDLRNPTWFISPTQCTCPQHPRWTLYASSRPHQGICCRTSWSTTPQLTHLRKRGSTTSLPQSPGSRIPATRLGPGQFTFCPRRGERGAVPAPARVEGPWPRCSLLLGKTSIFI